ncbi:hypothetical protein [Halorhabdus sp. SVX81]|uniref:hypothetical protein n=1 Tax=Halorhabdus sp. SVX81 TaxID=2978283 RepID=UPI0023DC4416|nr:hypothetical protein [Halorhabdus sp. SVX81]
MNRRTFLAGTSTVVTAALGGCTMIGDGKNGREGVILTHVELGNGSGESQVFDVLVTHNDDTIYWSSEEVGSGEGEGEVIEIDSPDEYGHVEVYVRVGDAWSQTDFDTDRFDGKHVIASVTYGMIEDDLLRISRLVSDRPTSTEG